MKGLTASVMEDGSSVYTLDLDVSVTNSTGHPIIDCAKGTFTAGALQAPVSLASPYCQQFQFNHQFCANAAGLCDLEASGVSVIHFGGVFDGAPPSGVTATLTLNVFLDDGTPVSGSAEVQM